MRNRSATLSGLALGCLVLLELPPRTLAQPYAWEEIGPRGGAASFLAVDPSSPGTLYAGTEDGVWRSTDGAVSWTPTAFDDEPNGLAVDPLSPGTLYAGRFTVYTCPFLDCFGTSFVLRKSVDAGDSWSTVYSLDFGSSPVDTGIPFPVAVSPHAAGTVHLRGHLKSTDGGATWTSGGGGLPPSGFVFDEEVTGLSLDPVTAGIVYVGWRGEGVFKSTDDGLTYTAVNTGLTNLNVTALAIDPGTPTTLYAGSAGGVFKTTDGGAHWNSASVGLPSLDVTALAVDPIDPVIVYAGIGSSAEVALFRSRNGGQTWARHDRGLPHAQLAGDSVLAIAADPGIPSQLYVGTNNLGTFWSPNAGCSWTMSNRGVGRPIERRSLAIDPASPTTLYVGNYKSTNQGASWTPLPSLRELGGDDPQLAIDPFVSSTIHAGRSGIPQTPFTASAALRSDDGGANWTAASPLPPGFAESIAVNPVTSAVYVGRQGAAAVFEGGPGGSSWTDISTGFPGIGPTTLEVEPGAATALYATGFSFSVARLQLVACAVDADCDDANDCTVDMCEAGTGTCTNTSAADGAPCDDGSPCSIDVCTAGACVSTADPACGCGAEAYCAPAPVPGCVTSNAARLLVKAKTAGKESIKVKLKKLVSSTTQGDFGDPVTGTTAYGLCVYDQSDALVGSMAVAKAGALCGAAQIPCWLAASSGYVYRDQDGLADGIQQIVAKGGAAGKGKLLAKGRNSASRGQTALPGDVAAALTGSASATVQVVTDDASCFGATLTNVSTADGLRFKAKGP